MEQAMVFFNLRKGWDDSVGEALGEVFKKKSEPVKIYRRILFVHCLNSVWASEFQIKEKKLLVVLNKRQRLMSIERIRFSI